MSLLPLLLALPEGVIAGVPCPLTRHREGVDSLDLFGPRLRSESELRSAAYAPPRRLIVELSATASLATDAALAATAEAGATVVLVAADLAALLRLSHRILVRREGALQWEAPSELLRRRVLCLRMTGAGRERRVRLPLGLEGAEPVLAACRARGWRVRESRVEYGWAPSR